jgi:hypothetical protein
LARNACRDVDSARFIIRNLVPDAYSEHDFSTELMHAMVHDERKDEKDEMD